MRKSENKLIAIIIGIALIFFGFYLLTKPFTTLISIATLLSIAILIRGIFYAFVFYRSVKKEVLLLLNSIIFIILGVFLLLNPVLSANLVLYLVSLWFILDAINGIFIAMKSSGYIKWISYILSVLLLFFGISLLFDPLKALFTLNILIGLSIILDGIQTIFNTFIEN